MKALGHTLCVATLATPVAIAVAAEVRAYPGAHRDQQLEHLVNADPKNQGVQSEV